MDANLSTDEGWARGRRSRVVLMPRSRHQVARKKFRVVTVATKPITGESTKQAVTPSRRECRMMRRTCGDYACVLFYLHTRLRVQRAPGIPCALLIRGILQLGRFARRETALPRHLRSAATPYLRPIHQPATRSTMPAAPATMPCLE